MRHASNANQPRLLAHARCIRGHRLQLVGTARAARAESKAYLEAPAPRRDDDDDAAATSAAAARARRGTFELVFCEWSPRRSSPADINAAQLEPLVSSCTGPDVLARWLASRGFLS